MLDGTLKQRVFSLEQAIEIQVRRDDVTYQNIVALSKDSSRIEKTITESLNDKTSTLEEALRVFRQEVHHRFELQNAENKRLQQHITSLKAENHQLQSELVRSFSLSLFLSLSVCPLSVSSLLTHSSSSQAKVSQRLQRVETEFGEDLPPVE
jgi:hypothetical protein